MKEALKEITQELSQGFRSLAEGWGTMREKASTALTRFRPGRPAHRYDRATDALPEIGPAWGLLAGEVFEDADKVTVRLEVPGMETKDFDLQVRDGCLLVRGEKRSERRSTDGAYRMVECAYGEFERAIALPAEVRADKVQAAYRRGVLTVELPKARRSEPRRIKVKVQ